MHTLTVITVHTLEPGHQGVQTHGHVMRGQADPTIAQHLHQFPLTLTLALAAMLALVPTDLGLVLQSSSGEVQGLTMYTLRTTEEPSAV
jgi:hypothetical protein